MLTVVAVLVGLVAGASLAAVGLWAVGGSRFAAPRSARQQLIGDAQREAETLRRESQIEAREQSVKLRGEIEAEIRDRRSQVVKLEERVLQRRRRRSSQAHRADAPRAGVADRETHLESLQEELKEAQGPRARRAAAHLRPDRERGEAAPARAVGGPRPARARPPRAPDRRGGAQRGEAAGAHLVADALQRVAASHAAETTVTVVELPTDAMKGRIIGREGRNIRALEHLTGVDFIIDDTPQAVVLSSFDGMRREVARLTLEKLIEDGRIHPSRIEEMYYHSKAELDEHIRQAGEQAVFEANCGEFHEELVKILGRLRYRTSYGQNVLKHTLEVVHLSGLMASELQASVKTAKRAALLHDLGKAMTHEIEGSHALISAQLARRYGESQGVVHAIEAHHYEVQPQTVEAVLLIAADAISASRPGRPRREPRELHQAARGARGAGGAEAWRREGLRAPGRPRDPRDREADRGRRRRRRSCSRTRSPARSRTSSSTPAR